MSGEKIVGRGGSTGHGAGGRETGGSAHPGSRILLILAKEPVPGRVKTRLAQDVGAERASAIYRRLAEETVLRLAAGPWTTRVCFDPPGSLPAFEAWLGSSGTAFVPQPGGDLGARIGRLLEEALKNADCACVVGTDAPGVDVARVEWAFRILEEDAEVDVVVNPAQDGGYVLLALRHAVPELFRGIPWSTPAVLDETLRAAARNGLETRLLPTLADVDTEADLELLPPGFPDEGAVSPP